MKILAIGELASQEEARAQEGDVGTGFMSWRRNTRKESPKVISLEQTRIVVERENIFALGVYPGAGTELQVGEADKSDQHSIWDKLSSRYPARPPWRARLRARSPH